MHREDKFHKIGFIRLKSMVLLKNDVVSNWRLHTQSDYSIVAELL